MSGARHIIKKVPDMANSLTQKRVDVSEFLYYENVITHFQPIVSIRRKVAVGLEALSRGVHRQTGELIPPGILFKSAEEQGLLLDLDRLCRKKAIEHFKTIHELNKGYLLFINLSTSLVDQGVVGSNKLKELVELNSINPRNIVIEILESKAENLSDLQLFTRNYKDYGFLIAIDDIGSGDSNLSRIHLLQPDILKVDMSIIRDLDKEYYKQEIFRSINGLSKNIGALVVAEGIETEEEALKAFELGADMLQGYYFSKPEHNLSYELLNKLDKTICHASSKYRNHILNKAELLKNRYMLCDEIIGQVVNYLESLSVGNYENALNKFIEKFAPVECFYILDENGIQLTETVYDRNKIQKDRRIIFQPAPKHTDHSLKEYFLFVKAGMDKYLSENYISLASGNLCITISKRFQGADSKEYVLCFDLNTG